MKQRREEGRHHHDSSGAEPASAVDVAALAELAIAESRSEVRKAALARIGRAVNADFALMASAPDDPDAVTSSSRAPASAVARAERRLVHTVARASDRVVQSEVAFAGRRGSRSLLCATVALRGRFLALLQLGRTRDDGFDDEDRDRVQEFLPVLALAEAAAPIGDVIVLTAREREIASFVGLGFTNAEIARALRLSQHTVRNHLAHAFAKAGVASRAALVRAVMSRMYQAPPWARST
jgi:DNA-binding CsgD family transcriptional regulator